MKKNPELVIFRLPQDLFKFAANDFKNRAITETNAKGFFSVVLSGGSTPKQLFDQLILDKKDIPWQNINFYFGDERYVPSDNKESNYHMAYEHLFSKVPVNPNNVYRIPTEFNDPIEAAKTYDNLLKEIQFDLIYLGLGTDAHTASLMPFSKPVIDYLDHTSTTNQLVSDVFVPELKMHRITLMPNAINQAQTIIFLVSGTDKAQAVWNVLKEENNPTCFPAQLIKSTHGKTIWYLDQAAAEKII